MFRLKFSSLTSSPTPFLLSQHKLSQAHVAFGLITLHGLNTNLTKNLWGHAPSASERRVQLLVAAVENWHLISTALQNCHKFMASCTHSSPPTTSFFVNSRTLLGCADPRMWGSDVGDVGAPHQCPLGSVVSYLFLFVLTLTCALSDDS